MGLEIEIKARIEEKEVDSVLEKLKSFPNARFGGELKKTDVYWADSTESKPFFRTRVEETEGKKVLLITSKPKKDKINGLEINNENEFEVSFDQKEKLDAFIQGLGLVICRYKYKQGYQFFIDIDGINLHAELLNVKYLGWFLEIEMTDEKTDQKSAECAILKVLNLLGIPGYRIEPTGYYKMLKACGHSLG